MLGAVIIDSPHEYRGQNYSRILWQFFRCVNCSSGIAAKIHDKGNAETAVLENVYPPAMEKAPLPANVPGDLIKEFREAELDAANGAYRSGSAMLRSVLEKALCKNGYEQVEVIDQSGTKRKSNKLIHRIDAAADDGVITDARKQRAHDSIRVLGNDVLHEGWREVGPEEFEDSHKYTQRILEDLYDDRPTIEKILKSHKRIP